MPIFDSIKLMSGPSYLVISCLITPPVLCMVRYSIFYHGPWEIHANGDKSA